MRTVAAVARASVRSRWRAHVAVALLVALTIGVALTAVAGARRTQSAYGRLLRAVHASTISVSSPGGYDAGVNASIAALPGVAQSRTYVGLNVYALRGGQPDVEQNFEGSGTLDGRYIDQDALTITRGRAFDPARDDEVVVNERAAERFGYTVGERLDLALYTTDAIQSPTFFTDPAPALRQMTVTIVGIGVLPEEVLQDDADRVARVLFTPAYTAESQAGISYGEQGLVLRDGDAGIDALRQGIAPLDPAGLSTYRVTSVDAFHADQAMRPLSIALVLFGLIAFLAGLLLAGQAVVRLVRVDPDASGALRAIGAPPMTIRAATAVGPVVAAALGLVGAVVLAVAASPLMPIGPVRRVEADPGVDVDWTVLLGGAALAAMVLVLLAVRSARRREPAVDATDVPPVVTAAVAAGLGPPAVAGVREAFGTGRDSRAAARSVILGACVAVAALVGAATFGASLRHLVDEPALFGWSGDLAATSGQGYGNFDLPGITQALAVPAVDAWSGAYFAAAPVDGREVQLLATDPAAPVAPPVVAGRGIAADDEIALGAQTAASLHRSIGDTVTFTSASGPRSLHVVGLVTLPTIGSVHSAHPSLGVGAVVAKAMLPRDRDITGAPATDVGPNVVFVRLQPGVDVPATAAALTEALRPFAGFAGIDVLPVQRPAEIVNAGSLGSAPVLLALALGVGALASLGVAIAASVRRRRRELAVLKVLGFTRGQIGATVAWHASIAAGVGLVVGIPVGIAAGRFLWSVFAGQLDVVSRPTVPMTAVAAVALATLVVANAVAVLPARRARRISASSALRDAQH